MQVQKKISGQEVCSIVDFYVHDFLKLKKKDSKTQQARVAKWEPPTDGFYKINVDATFIDATSKGGWSFVARDKEVEYMEGGCGNLPRVACPLQVEAMAPLFSLERAAYVGMSKIILKTDATELEKGITTK
jgi:hypothetical protein